MQAIYFEYDPSGNIIAVYGNLQPDLTLTAIPVDDPRYEAWYNALTALQQQGWPAPSTAA